MDLFIKLSFAFLMSFFVALIIAPIIIYILKKQKAKQTILSYVDFHEKKQGTPTMGGIIFLIAIAISSLVLFRGDVKVACFSVLFAVLFGLIGFVDDFIKVFNKKNEGLTPLQKLAFQFVVSLLFGIFMYLNGITKLIIPFSNIAVDISFGIIILSVVVMLATTNAVNLTDGLDGLAATTTLVFMLAISILISINSEVLNIKDSYNMQLIAICSAGALFGFLFYNGYPAKIFMGDTGSIGLGGLVSVISLVTGNTLYILLLGLVFVISTMSVIIQVLHFKRTKKRVFLMAPLHHHFEKKGMHEVKIVTMYIIISVIISILTLIIEYII